MNMCVNILNVKEKEHVKDFKESSLENRLKTALVDALNSKGIGVFIVDNDEELTDINEIERKSILYANSKSIDLFLTIDLLQNKSEQKGCYASCSTYEAILYANSILSRLSRIFNVNGLNIDRSRLLLEASNVPSIVLEIQDEIDVVSNIGVNNIAECIVQGIILCI